MQNTATDILQLFLVRQYVLHASFGLSSFAVGTKCPFLRFLVQSIWNVLISMHRGVIAKEATTLTGSQYLHGLY